MTSAIVPAATAPGFDIVVICASLGGSRSICAIVDTLPPTLPVPIVVVQHRRPQTRDLLVDLLTRCSRLPVRTCRAGVLLEPGVTVVPAGHYAELNDDVLTAVPCDDHSGDRTFMSAANEFGSQTLAIVLTGRLDDGARGAQAVRRAGGTVIVEDPATAQAPDMPRAALATGCVDFRLSPAIIGSAITGLVMATGLRAHLATPAPPSWAQFN